MASFAFVDCCLIFMNFITVVAVIETFVVEGGSSLNQRNNVIVAVAIAVAIAVATINACVITLLRQRHGNR